MKPTGTDIWFGPGGLKGVFGAGVALGLHEAARRGEIDPGGHALRLFGSSVGCLNAVYLATGNAEHGLPIYQHEIAGMINPGNLLPSLAARLANRLAAGVGRSQRTMPPSVLNVDHVFDVMRRLTPAIVEQIRAARLPVFAETLDLGSNAFRHVDLRRSPAPLHSIRHALNCFPFSLSGDDRMFDSSIKGYGFPELLKQVSGRRLVVVLNNPPQLRIRDRWGEIAAALLAARRNVAQLYLRRPLTRRAAIHAAMAGASRVLLVCPRRPLWLKDRSDFERVHADGRSLARGIVQFIQKPAENEALFHGA
jgi:hypothetical protein